MDIHKNAPLTPKGREAMVRRVVEGGQTPKAVSAAVGSSTRRRRRCAKWVARFRAEGVDGLRRSLLAAAFTRRVQTPPEIIARDRRAAAPALDVRADRERDPRLESDNLYRILRRLGLNRLKALEPAEPVRRYEREHPGELIHIDIKKLGKIGSIGHRITGDRTGQTQPPPGVSAGSSFMSASTTPPVSPSVSVMKDEKRQSAVAFLKAAVAYYASLGVNGRARHDRQRLVLPFLSLPPTLASGSASSTSAPSPTRPKPTARPSASSRPALREWAYAHAYNTSDRREPSNCRDGFTDTIGIDLTASIQSQSHPSADSA